MIIKGINFSRGNIERLKQLAKCTKCNTISTKLQYDYPECPQCKTRENIALINELNGRLKNKTITKEEYNTEWDDRAIGNEYREDYNIQDGDIIEGNLSQSRPHTDLTGYSNGKNVTIRNYNLMNCDVPGNVTLDNKHGGHLLFHKSLCGHLHKNRVDNGDLEACSENCEHVKDFDEIIIDSESTGKIYHYEDKVVS